MAATTHRWFDRDLETADEEAITAMQGIRLRARLDAVSTNPFYRHHYRRANVNLDQIVGPADLRRLPILRKRDVLADAALSPPYGARLAVDRTDICNIVESSGTSGAAPELQALTATDLEAVLDAEAVGFIWAGAGPGTVVALNAPVTMTAAGYWWTLALYRLRCNVLRLSALDTLERLRYLQRYQAQQLLAGAHYLRRMAHVAAAEGIDPARDLPALQVVFLGGGGWSLSEAQQWSRLWGATVAEQYGNSQRCIAWTCELGAVHGERAGIVHGLPHDCILEVVDPDTGESAEDGQQGEIVITLLNQTAMPLIRYGTADLAVRRVGAGCRCGRRFDGIEAGSVRRRDGMMRVRGTNLWPETVDATVFAHEAAVDYRAVVLVDESQRERIDLSVEIRANSRNDRASLAARLMGELKAATGLTFNVAIDDASPANIGSSERITAKAARWTDRRVGGA